MAILNGKNVFFEGFSFAKIGEIIADGSPSGDGKGIKLSLTPEEEASFEKVGGLKVGYSIASLVADAIEKRTGKRPEGLKYRYQNLILET